MFDCPFCGAELPEELGVPINHRGPGYPLLCRDCAADIHASFIAFLHAEDAERMRTELGLGN